MALPPFATAATRTDRHAPRDANPTPPTIDLGEFLRYQELAAHHAKAAELSPFSHKVPLWIVSNRGTVELNDNSASKLKLNPLRNTFCPAPDSLGHPIDRSNNGVHDARIDRIGKLPHQTTLVGKQES